jgi:hypothetical protein
LPQLGPLPWLPLALTPLWQVAQVTPDTTACTILQVADEPPLSKLVVLAWHEVQSAAPVGIWPPALACAPLVPWLVYDPLWQESHRLALTAVWFIV